MSQNYTGKEKCRYVQFLVYPESAPADWIQILDDSFGQYVISPEHCPDEKDSKPHHHVIYCHGNSSTLNAIRRCIPDEVPANGLVIPCAHPRACQRYLLHLDNPDKQQFEDGALSLIVLNNFPLDLTRELSKAEQMQLRDCILQTIDEFNMTEYAELIDFLFKSCATEELDYACNHTVFLNTYLSSRRHGGFADSNNENTADN